MFLKLLKAEWYKILGNRAPTAFLIGIFPVFGIMFLSFFVFVVLVSAEAREEIQLDPPLWTDTLVGIWNIPNGLIGRAVILAFVALQFGGEYQWNTWKNIVPRSERVPLVLAKFIMVTTIILLSFTLTSIIAGVGVGAVTKAAGASYGPPISEDILRDFAGDYLLQVTTALVSTIIGAGYAMIAAMITRSILGSLIVSFVIATAEGLSFLAFVLVAFFLKETDILLMYRYTPTYNLFNVMTWLNENHANNLLDWEDNVVASDSLSFSVIVLFVWVFGLLIATSYAFRRQDIVN